MSITYVPFVPQPGQAFGFSAVFDGQTYQVVIYWNAYGQRWYVNIVAAGNVGVVNMALIGSPDSGNINMLAGYFVTSTLVYRVSTQTFEIGP